jgi:hypothetical protein
MQGMTLKRARERKEGCRGLLLWNVVGNVGKGGG